MATTTQLLAIRAPTDAALERSLRKLEVRGSARTEHWSVHVLGLRLPLPKLDALLVRLEKRADAVLGAAVEDGDYAYLAFLSKQGKARAVVGPEGARGYADGHWALTKASEPRASVLGAISAWSSLAPQHLDEADVQAILTRDWLDAVDAVERLLELLGLPWPEEADRLSDGQMERYHEATLLIPVTVRKGRQAVQPKSFVFGMGRGFVGIWARSGGDPVERFSNDPDGRARALEVLSRLEADH